MKTEKEKNIVIVILLCIIILLIVFILLIATKKIKITSKTDNEDNQYNETIKKDSTNNTNIQQNLNGKYTNKSENENSYHYASIEITNQNETTFNFKIEALHGMDIDHVNIGNVSGTAIKIDNNTYEFEEEIDGQTSKITFKFNNNKVTITENYPDNINPYAGHNVYFAGNYTKEI